MLRDEVDEEAMRRRDEIKTQTQTQQSSLGSPASAPQQGGCNCPGTGCLPSYPGTLSLSHTQIPVFYFGKDYSRLAAENSSWTPLSIGSVM